MRKIIHMQTQKREGLIDITDQVRTALAEHLFL